MVEREIDRVKEVKLGFKDLCFEQLDIIAPWWSLIPMALSRFAGDDRVGRLLPH